MSASDMSARHQRYPCQQLFVSCRQHVGRQVDDMSPQQTHKSCFDPRFDMPTSTLPAKRIMCSMAAVWRMYGYQEYPAPEPPVCAFKVCSGAQLKDFIQQCKVTDLQIYCNRPAKLDALKYTDFLTKYNTSSKLPKYYGDCPNTLNTISVNQHYFKVYMDPD